MPVSRKQWLAIGLPIAVIVILLPVAIWIGLEVGNNSNDRVDPPSATAEPPPSEEGNTVFAEDLSFRPGEVQVRSGEILTFRNPSLTAHSLDLPGDETEIPLPAGEDV